LQDVVREVGMRNNQLEFLRFKSLMNGMPMTHLFYIDESMEGDHIALVAIRVSIEDWRASLDCLKSFRRDLRATAGVSVAAELHATELVGERGVIGGQRIGIRRGVDILQQSLGSLSKLPNVKIIGAHSRNKRKMDQLFEWTLNRIEQNIRQEESHAILICDKGKEALYPSISRRMRHYNYIPSQFGDWGTGEKAKNIQLERFIEDPVFVDSRHSLFIQAADHAAYSLLRHCVPHPNPRKRAFGLDGLYRSLDTALEKRANAKDPDRLGIIRVW
jgi:hypothetical protein